MAALNDHPEVVRALLSCSASVRESGRGYDYDIALKIASDKGHGEIVELLRSRWDRLDRLGCFGTALEAVFKQGFDLHGIGDLLTTAENQHQIQAPFPVHWS